MKYAFLLILSIPFCSIAQIQGEDEVYLKNDRIEASFNGGGLKQFSTFINKNFDYSKVTKEGTLEATFTIEKEGNLTKIKITSLLDIDSATEFIRVLKLCPNWQPATRGGKPIAVEIKYPMVFKRKKAK